MGMAPNRISPARLIAVAEICCGENWREQPYHTGTAPIGTNELITEGQMKALRTEGTTGEGLVLLGLARKNEDGYLLFKDILLHEAHAAEQFLNDRPAPMQRL